MASDEDTLDKCTNLYKQLALARTEINNLRKEMKTLKYSHSKEIANIKSALESWRCSSCKATQNVHNGMQQHVSDELSDAAIEQESVIELKPIGYISTEFARKRAVPRQPNLNLNSSGKIFLFNSVFTNPEHSLQGLEGFSHMWILFYFNKNNSSHVRAKVAPPRLNGARVGVFGTRSPHRPCPIGLSLVQIDRISGSEVYFSGVDMLDGSPVLDLKPYIPHYDNPSQLTVDYSQLSPDMERLELDGQESDHEEKTGLPVPPPQLPTVLQLSPRLVRPGEREAPDGQEEQLGAASPSPLGPSLSPLPTHRPVRVPDWISQSTVPLLQVTFTPQAESQLAACQQQNITKVISDILREDPRSVYLRDRYANQFYTFLISNYHVCCKFDDGSHSVKVFRVMPADSWCPCGQPAWQCPVHGVMDS